ncbi:hypothetical protein ACQY0O_000105 [Thecaphora frezii]
MRFLPILSLLVFACYVQALSAPDNSVRKFHHTINGVGTFYIAYPRVHKQGTSSNSQIITLTYMCLKADDSRIVGRPWTVALRGPFPSGRWGNVLATSNQGNEDGCRHMDPSDGATDHEFATRIQLMHSSRKSNFGPNLGLIVGPDDDSTVFHGIPELEASAYPE